MITKAELEEAVNQTIALAERIKSWRREDQGQLAVGAHYANLHIVALASTLGGMLGICDQLERTPQANNAVVLRSSASERVWGITVTTSEPEGVDVVELDPQTGGPLAHE